VAGPSWPSNCKSLLSGHGEERGGVRGGGDEDEGHPLCGQSRCATQAAPEWKIKDTSQHKKSPRRGLRGQSSKAPGTIQAVPHWQGCNGHSKAVPQWQGLSGQSSRALVAMVREEVGGGGGEEECIRRRGWGRGDEDKGHLLCILCHNY